MLGGELKITRQKMKRHSNDFRRHTKYFTNYGIYFKQRLLLSLHFYNKLHCDHHQMTLINTIDHFSISSVTFS